jgi:hypothetical protein
MFPKFLGSIDNKNKNKQWLNYHQWFHICPLWLMDDIHHIIVSHCVLNDYCFKQLMHNNFRIINQFCLL